MNDTIIPGAREFSAREYFAGSFDWWRDAGVDYDFADSPTGWLAAPEPVEPPAAPSVVLPPKPLPQTPLQRALAPEKELPPAIAHLDLPDDLEAFRQWWMTEPTLANGSLENRLPPRGVPRCPLMVLVSQPEADDQEGLLTGSAGKVLDAMLRAMGLASHEVYYASALPRTVAMPEWDRLAARGLGTVLRRHIKLAAPQRILSVGRMQLTLLDVDPADAREALMIDCEGSAFSLLATPDFAQLERSAQRRSNFWTRWLDWTA